MPVELLLWLAIGGGVGGTALIWFLQRRRAARMQLEPAPPLEERLQLAESLTEVIHKLEAVLRQEDIQASKLNMEKLSDSVTILMAAQRHLRLSNVAHFNIVLGDKGPVGTSVIEHDRKEILQRIGKLRVPQTPYEIMALAHEISEHTGYIFEVAYVEKSKGPQRSIFLKGT